MELDNNLSIKEYINFEMILPIYMWSKKCEFRELY